MKKIIVSCIMVFALMTAIIAPQPVSAESSIQQATDELKQAEAKQKEAAENLKNAQSKIKKIQAEKKKASKDIYALEDDIDSLEHQIKTLDQTMVDIDSEINTLDTQINTLNEQIEQTNDQLSTLEKNSDQVETNLLASKQALQAAIDRINQRDALIRERLRYMYTNGSVPYMEVLLHSTSFKDFLERFQILKTLVDHDQDILQKNKEDYAQITLQVAEVESELAQLVTLYDQQVEIKNEQTLAMNEQTEAKDQQLEAKERQLTTKHTQEAAQKKLLAMKRSKNNQIALLSKEEVVLAEYTEEQEQAMIDVAAIIAASKKSIVYYKGGKLGYPLPEAYRISSEFGKRTNPITGEAGAMHSGIDFAAPEGTDILAAETGIVITAGWINGYGNVVILDHGDGLWTIYAHARKGGIQVEVGQTVKKAEKISEVGTTGNSTGYHLHFEVRLDKKAVNPRDYLNL